MLETLKKTRALIANRENWTQGYDRLTTHDGVVKYCLYGALYEVHGGDLIGSPLWKLLVKLAGSIALSDFNDHHTHREVLALLDTAIAEAEKEIPNAPHL